MLRDVDFSSRLIDWIYLRLRILSTCIGVSFSSVLLSIACTVALWLSTTLASRGGFVGLSGFGSRRFVAGLSSFGVLAVAGGLG